MWFGDIGGIAMLEVHKALRNNFMQCESYIVYLETVSAHFDTLH